jgi:hypothetical protein
MPKLSSITFCIHNDFNYYNPKQFGVLFDENKHINVQLTSVTTVCLREVPTKKIQKVLISSFPNLRCLILDCTKLPSKENQLTSFLGQKLQRIEMNEFF